MCSRQSDSALVGKQESVGQQPPRPAVMSAAATFQGHPDRYGGLLVDLRHEIVLQDNSFQELLSGNGEALNAELICLDKTFLSTSFPIIRIRTSRA